MDSSGSGIDDAAGALAHFSQRDAFLTNQIGNALPAMAHRMRPASLGVAAYQDFVGRIEEQDLGRGSTTFYFGRYRGPLRKEDTLARVDAERHAREIFSAFHREAQHRRRQCDRQIIDAVEAQVLEHPHRGSAPGAGDAGHYDQTRLLKT